MTHKENVVYNMLESSNSPYGLADTTESELRSQLTRNDKVSESSGQLL